MLRSRFSPLLLLVPLLMLLVGFACLAPETAHAAAVSAGHALTLPAAAPTDSTTSVLMAGTWVMTIRGTGIHHNGIPDDADALMREFVKQLKAKSFFLREAKFELTQTGPDGIEVVQPHSTQHIDFLAPTPDSATSASS